MNQEHGHKVIMPSYRKSQGELHQVRSPKITKVNPRIFPKPKPFPHHLFSFLIPLFFYQTNFLISKNQTSSTLLSQIKKRDTLLFLLLFILLPSFLSRMQSLLPSLLVHNLLAFPFSPFSLNFASPFYVLPAPVFSFSSMEPTPLYSNPWLYIAEPWSAPLGQNELPLPNGVGEEKLPLWAFCHGLRERKKSVAL